MMNQIIGVCTQCKKNILLKQFRKGTTLKEMKKEKLCVKCVVANVASTINQETLKD